MMNFRIIPRLDVKNNNLIKGINFEGLKILGKPEEFSKFYYENGADELILTDAVASLYGINSLHGILEEIVKNISLPISAGGGITNIETIRKLMNSGADRVILNTYAVRNPKFLEDAVKYFGSSSIIVAIDYKIKKSSDEKNKFSYEVFIENGKQQTNVDAYDWAIKCQKLGVGEILFTCIDKEGLMKGAEFELPQKISSNLNIPFLVGGGIGKKEHIFDLQKNTNCSGVSLASLIHYKKDNILNIKSYLKQNSKNIIIHD